MLDLIPFVLAELPTYLARAHDVSSNKDIATGLVGKE